MNDEKWGYGEARCKFCGWEWVAIAELPIEWLECPNCGKICGELKDING